MSYRDCLDTSGRLTNNTETAVSITNSPTEHSADTAVHMRVHVGTVVIHIGFCSDVCHTNL
jgi:hypothetical protein